MPFASAAVVLSTKKKEEEKATLVLYSVSFQIENDSMATPMKAAPFNSGMLFCAPIHSCSFEKISSFSSSFHVDNLLCLLLKACELYTSIMMSIWMYEHYQPPHHTTTQNQKTLANAETLLLPPQPPRPPRRQSKKMIRWAPTQPSLL